MRLGYEDFKGLIERFVNEAINHLSDKMLACAIFGSVARDSATKNSDVERCIKIYECRDP